MIRGSLEDSFLPYFSLEVQEERGATVKISWYRFSDGMKQISESLVGIWNSMLCNDGREKLSEILEKECEPLAIIDCKTGKQHSSSTLVWLKLIRQNAVYEADDPLLIYKFGSLWDVSGFYRQVETKIGVFSWLEQITKQDSCSS